MGIRDYDEPLPIDVQQVVDSHTRVDGIPSPGDPDWNAYAILFRDLAEADRDGRPRSLLFSRRKTMTDFLWRAGYRKVECSCQHRQVAGCDHDEP